MTHSVFAIVAPVALNRVPELQVWLDPHDQGVATVPGLPFDVIGTLHFASVVVFPAPRAEGLPVLLAGTLVFESCVDGPLAAYLDTLVHVGEAALATLFAHCIDYKPDGKNRKAYLRRYLEEHVRRPHLHHIGNPRMPRHQIAAGATLRGVLDGELDRLVSTGRSFDGATEIVSQLRDVLKVPPSAKEHWHLAPDSAAGTSYAWYADPAFPWLSRLYHWTRLATLVLTPLVVAGWAIQAGHARAALVTACALLALAWLIWRWHTGRHPGATVDPAALHLLTEREDRGVRNHMTSLIPLKPGLARRLATRTVLFTFNLFYRTWFTDITPGRLSGLPTIQFAQWTVVPCFDAKGRPTKHSSLMFLSNYDGSWETYLDDFLAHLLKGVIAIWAGTHRFPSPLDDPTFKQWARSRMSPWQVWYQHASYGPLTVLNIHNNDAIRKGLLRAPESDHAARLWLARFGAIKEGHETFDETRELEEDEIQGLVASGFPALEMAAYVPLRISDSAKARQWLATLLPRITTSRERSREEREAQDAAINVAFTWRGLRAAGLGVPVLDQFPLAFKEGMAPGGLTHRSRILGDTDDSEPKAWIWGNEREPVDLLLMVFTRAGHRDIAAELVKKFKDSGAGQEVEELRIVRGELMRPPGAPPKAIVEHFGFRDGLSDPVLEGSWRARGQSASSHLMKPGEFLLGYPAADGTLAPGIAVDRAADPLWLLPPVLDRASTGDFGRNGTYLVCRQLSQQVGAFRAFLAKAAGGTHTSPEAEAVAARMTGRWRNGVPLHAGSGDPAELSNEFGFADDPHGFHCPIGAHIRRANPRDFLGVDAASSLRSANRHRLIRRGRPYGPPLPADVVEDDGQPRGLFFICLNGDIERQFEFVQQNWINNTAFGGLYSEIDPLVGGHRGPAYHTVQASAVRQRIAGLGQFVTTRGGQYFFLPSLSSLRYLASIAEPAAPVGPPMAAAALQPVAPSPVRPPTHLHKAFAAFEAIAPWLATAWAARVPLLLAASLFVLALGPRLSPAFAATLFLTENRRGAFAVALVASLAASVAMVTLRIVLLYGERLGLSRSRWNGPARWLQVLAFQALAFPLVWQVINQTASDRADASQLKVTFWDGVFDLAPAAVAGLVSGLACMWLATAVQALRPGARSDLFFPPNPLARWAAMRGRRVRPPRWMERRLNACARWIVDAVPHDMGTGYVDYRRRRLLSGHVFALSLATVVVALYVAGYFVLYPGWSGRAGYLPPVTYLLIVLIVAGWALSGLTFFLDRYRFPTLAVLVAWLAAVTTLTRTDHHFPVKGPLEPAVSPHVMMQRADRFAPSSHVVVVASEGLGLVSSAWTAEVLTRLAETLKDDFTRSLRLVSAASGASLGTVFFVNEYTPHGFGSGAASEDGAGRPWEAIRARARTPSSSEGAWGLAYPDLLRLFVPVFVPRLIDRDWARETAWRRAFEGQDPTLSSWRRDVAKGWRPAVVFGVTVVESGERGLIATYESPKPTPAVTADKDVSMLTAARLAAAFPFISAAARPDTGSRAAFHLTDGGYWDNSGIVSALEWLEAAQPARPERVVFVEIRSSSARQPHGPDNASWLLELTAPLRTLVGVRYEGQPYRNAAALESFRDLWKARHGVDLPHVVFDLRDDRLPLTWNLGKAAPAQLEAAWKRADVQEQVESLRALLTTAR
jgi:Dyp-type peroxidase family